MSEIVISRLELYPEESPTGYEVGFITKTSGKCFYMDVVVSFSEADTEEKAVDVGYEKLKDAIEERVEMLEKTKTLVGTVYKP